MEMPVLEQSQVAFASLENPMLSLSLIPVEVRDACLLPHLSFASVTSAVVWTNLC